jgi:protoporphyrinogen oxidase
MWEAFAREITGAGGDIRLNSRVVALHHDGGRITSVDVDSDGTRYRQPVANVISTMPVRQLVQQLTPAPPPSVVEAAAALKYRDFLTVALIIEQRDVFADNWIYIHDDQVRVGRIQNYKNWSPHMVPDARFTCLGLEYFCFDGDGLWSSSSDADLVALATRELEAIGLVTAGLVRDGTVVRVAKAYPVYDQGYEVALEAVKAFVAGFENLQLVGRNGMHTYNNQDHSMLTAMLAVGNICGESHDLWSVNADDEYHEEQSVRRAEPRRHLGGSPAPRAVPRLL